MRKWCGRLSNCSRRASVAAEVAEQLGIPSPDSERVALRACPSGCPELTAEAEGWVNGTALIGQELKVIKP